MKRHVFVFLAFLLAAHVTGCATKPPTDERGNASILTHRVELKADSSSSIKSSSIKSSSIKSSSIKSASSSISSKPSLPNRLTDALGISTPEGRARRQAVKLAKATAPKVGKGGVYAVNSSVSNGFKTTAPVTQADTGATVSNAAENSQQQNVKGDHNDLDAKQANPHTDAPGAGAVLADNLTAWVPWVVGGAAVLGLVVFLIRRKAAKAIV